MAIRNSKRARLIAALVTAFIVFGVFAFRLDVEVRHFEFETDLLPDGASITLVQLSDFHSNHYGPRQNRLINKVALENPDAILLTGDILDRRFPTNNAVELVEELSVRWPVFFGFGNHEFLSRWDLEFEKILEANGVVVLRGEAVDFEVAGAVIQIGGLDDPAINWARPGHDSYQVQVQRLGSQLNPELFSVVMSHRPDRIVDFVGLPPDAQPDLVLSGHAHGGQWAIPGILPNGLFAPGQGLFPRMTNGLFDVSEVQMIVSRGLSLYAPPIAPDFQPT